MDNFSIRLTEECDTICICICKNFSYSIIIEVRGRKIRILYTNNIPQGRKMKKLYKFFSSFMLLTVICLSISMVSFQASTYKVCDYKWMSTGGNYDSDDYNNTTCFDSANKKHQVGIKQGFRYNVYSNGGDANTVRVKTYEDNYIVDAWLKDSEGRVEHTNNWDDDAYLTMGAKSGTDYHSFNMYYHK